MSAALDTGTIGWKGFMKVSSTEVGSGKVLPFTTEDLTETIEAIPNDGIHGGGVSELDGKFGSRHNVSIGPASYAGSVNGDVFTGTGQYADAFRIILDASMGRSTGNHTRRLQGFDDTNPIIVAPAGEDAFQYPSTEVFNFKTGATDTLTTPVKAVVSSLTLNGNNGGNVTYSASIMATSRKSVTGVAPVVGDFAFESVSQLDDSNPLPYWQASFDLNGSGEDFNGSSFDIKDFITDWSITINNNTNPVYTFNGNNVATDMVQGLMEVTGSFSYYSPNGKFETTLTNGATVTLGFGTVTLNIPYMFFPTAPIPNPGINTIVTRNVEFQGLAATAGASIFIT